MIGSSEITIPYCESASSTALATAAGADIALFSPQAWQQRYAVGLDCTTDECRQQAFRQHRHFEARQRQLAAVLQAHGVPVNFVHCDAGADAVDALT